MTNATIRTAVQAAHAAINGAKSRGPTSAAGKERSSLNSVRYGFSGAHLLLPGEDAAEYERHLDGYFAALVPTLMPEAVIVAQLGDLSWKLERLTKVENNRLRARLEEELEKTDTYKMIACTRHALELVDAIALTVEAVPVPPQEAERMGPILAGVERIVGFLGEVPELPQAVVQPLSQALDAAKESLSKDRVKKDEYAALGNAAKMVRGALREKLACEEAALQPLRERLAAEVLLLEDADLKKMERHRRLLENSMQRQLALLDQVRAQVTTARPEAQAGAKELRVKLRVVK
ncbi:hypothetical protein COCOR_04429 [Corallococcus coralloides DSM 2259]|uniref:Uncharacterized protein n=1 Tax=Corallococcus coralloides (strain ATCC 25202 / DSM 2259 / NBRC 100086 / M2) TaxID=1144275 RepID=H8MFB0_CORCM|nr:hypothetical protein [Corallococcus coralloides]AFE05830.1 hypothetical protein COCOR_04429 [Corallococcus coralloides DSM 2259]